MLVLVPQVIQATNDRQHVVPMLARLQALPAGLNLRSTHWSGDPRLDEGGQIRLAKALGQRVQLVTAVRKGEDALGAAPVPRNLGGVLGDQFLHPLRRASRVLVGLIPECAILQACQGDDDDVVGRGRGPVARREAVACRLQADLVRDQQDLDGAGVLTPIDGADQVVDQDRGVQLATLRP